MEHFVGEKLYLSQKTGSYYVDLIKTPWTVIYADDKEIIIQEAGLIFYGKRYFDTLPDEIVENPNGAIKTLKKSRAKRYKDQWVCKSYPGDTYPDVAHFGRWEYFPYLD